MAGEIVQFRLTPQEAEVLLSMGNSAESIGMIAKGIIQELIARKMEKDGIQTVDSSIQDGLMLNRGQIKELIKSQTEYIVSNTNELIKEQREELAKLRQELQQVKEKLESANVAGEKIEGMSKTRVTRKSRTRVKPVEENEDETLLKSEQ